MTATAIAVAVLLAGALWMVLVRIVRGPTTLDRIVATDVLLAVTAGAIATEAAYTRDATGLPILLGISLLGAVGSISVARFASLRHPHEPGPAGAAEADTPPDPPPDEPPDDGIVDAARDATDTRPAGGGRP